MDYFIEHIEDLSKNSYLKNRFVFSAFLNADEQSEIEKNKRNLISYKFFGGTDNCERRIVRFGSEEELGYSHEFPIVCVEITPLNAKFSDNLTHRDFLGSLMNLGIERNTVGDIIVNENSAYIFVLDTMADYITQNITKIKHTSVKCSVCDNIPENSFYKTQDIKLTVSSMRIDCIISSLFNLSRNKTNEFFTSKRVFVNSLCSENNSYNVSLNDIISLRGYGKFIVSEISGHTKKGRIILIVKKYI